MDISNIIMTIQVLLSALGTVYFLENGYGLWGLAVNLLLTSIFSLICNIYFSKRVLPQYSLNISLFKISRFKEIFSYSVNLQLSSLTRFWVEPLNKVIISHLYPVSYVGFYDIALKFINQLNGLINSALSPIFPAAAEIHELHGIEKVELLRKKSIKYILPASIAMYSFVFMVIPGFVQLWLSSELTIISPVIQIFLLSSFMITLAIPAYTILNGLGYANDTFKVQIQSLIINLIGIASLSQITGFLGFCTAYSISIMYGFFATHHYYKKRFSNEINVYRQFLDKKILIWGAIVILCEVIIVYIMPFTSYWKIAIGGIICAIVFTGLIIKFRIFNTSDMESLLGKKVANKFIVRHCNSK
jgi:O-antigen/teichoic acid export membrane protein